MSAKRSLVVACLPLLAVSLLGTGCGSRQARRGPAEMPPPVVVEEPPVVVPHGGPGPVVVKEGPVVVAGGPAPVKNGPPAHAPAHGYRRKHQAQAVSYHNYHYYPSRYLYYSPQRGLYWYMRNGQWEVSVNLPDFLNKDGLGEFVVVKSENENPYMEFELHKSEHPAPEAKATKKAKGKQGKGKNGKGKGKGKAPEDSVE